MTERSLILFPDEVRAILDGRQTQIRRPVKPQSSEEWNPGPVDWYHPTVIDRDGEEQPGKPVFGASDEREGRVCPFGKPGDRLWCRETFAGCPAGASRITLEVTAVRVEQLAGEWVWVAEFKRIDQ